MSWHSLDIHFSEVLCSLYW